MNLSELSRIKLPRAIALAAEAHDGQVDKAGAPYILHPLRVMLQMETDEERIVAVLHDILEDTHVDGHTISNLFGSEIFTAVYALTRQKDETYHAFIERAKKNPLARKVKIADIRDNLRPGAPHLRARYENALLALYSEEEERG